MKLKNKTAIITGGAQGIGKATARIFATEGAQVVILDRDEISGKKTEAEFQTEKLMVEFAAADVTNFESVNACITDLAAKYGKIDILINNAGITRDATLMKMTAEQWQTVMDVNLTGVFNCTKTAAPFMVEQKYGRIINTSSVVGIYGNFGQTNYVATKSGIIGMTKVWARELGRKGITVNAVAPGFIATEMIHSVPEKVIDMLKEKTPLGRLGTPDDIAQAYLFLASDEASFINGATLQVDGGLVM